MAFKRFEIQVPEYLLKLIKQHQKDNEYKSMAWSAVVLIYKGLLCAGYHVNEPSSNWGGKRDV